MDSEEVKRADIMVKFNLIKDHGYNIDVNKLSGLSLEELEKEYFKFMEELKRDEFIYKLKASSKYGLFSREEFNKMSTEELESEYNKFIAKYKRSEGPMTHVCKSGLNFEWN